jgi:hypothetical protein
MSEVVLPDAFGPTIRCDYEGLKRMAKEFFDTAPSATPPQLDNGYKCFLLACLGCQFGNDFIGNVQKNAELPALKRIVERDYMKHRFSMEMP